jgi:hypothetical protein
MFFGLPRFGDRGANSKKEKRYFYDSILYHPGTANRCKNLKMKYSEIKLIVNRLRSNLTPAEKVLWQNLRNRQLLGRKFIHQSAII